MLRFAIYAYVRKAGRLPLIWLDDEFGASAECHRLTADCEFAVNEPTFKEAISE